MNPKDGIKSAQLPPPITSLTNITPEQARHSFSSLLLTNENYFGNLATSKLKNVIKIAGDTTYEKVTCLGYHPGLKRLEAVVSINLDSGYNGDVCSPGSQEFVRFYLSYDEGATWQDEGVVSFTVHDTHGDKPQSFAVSQSIEPKATVCNTPTLPLARAILSWHQAPPANSPNWSPVWGNVLDERIQIAPLAFIDIGKLLSMVTVAAKSPLLGIFDANLKVAVAKPSALNEAALEKMYAQAGAVPAHRYAFETLHQTALHPAGAVTTSLSQTDLSAAILKFKQTKGDTTFESLDCIGLDENRDLLAGVVHVKQNTGYSGDLCSAGSKEYVAFWIDWGDGAGWTYVGTPTVDVHDIAMPPGGLHYAVVIPVDVAKHVQPCQKGPRTARLRAILSWQAAPPSNDPNWVPTWGNVQDTHVFVRPGVPAMPGVAAIAIIGGIGVADIDTVTTGMTKPAAKFAHDGSFADPWLVTRPCPFGGLITIQEYLGSMPPGAKYRVIVQKVGTLTPIPVTNPFGTVDFNGVFTNRTPDGNGWVPVLAPNSNIENMLAFWYSGGDDMWTVKLELDNGSGTVTTSPSYLIQVDNTGPSATLDPPTIALHIDNGGDCMDFDIPNMVRGHFTARDVHFGAYGMVTTPQSLPHVNAPSPSSGTVQTAVFPGDQWSLDTTGMKQCGYVIRLDVWDRTIVGSQSGSHNSASTDVGFCLRSVK